MCWRKQWKVRRERVAVYVRSLSRARARDRWVLLVSEPWGMLRKALGRGKALLDPGGQMVFGWVAERKVHLFGNGSNTKWMKLAQVECVWGWWGDWSDWRRKVLLLRWQGKQEKLCRLWRTLDNGWERFFSYVQWGGDCWEHSRCTAWL